MVTGFYLFSVHHRWLFINLLLSIKKCNHFAVKIMLRSYRWHLLINLLFMLPLIFFVQVFVFTSYGRHVVKLFNNGLRYYPSTKSKRLCNGSSFCLVLDHCQLLYISSHIHWFVPMELKLATNYLQTTWQTKWHFN